MQVRFTVIAISQTYNFRSSSLNKVIQAGIAIISCTVTEILVVGHLMLIVQANHDFMIAGIVSYVIFYIPHCVVDCVIVSEKFFTKKRCSFDCLSKYRQMGKYWN